VIDAALLNELLEAEVELDYHCELDYGTGNLRAEPASLEQLRRVLRPDELLLEYVLNNNASFCLRATRESARIVTLPASSSLLDNLVKTYLANVASGRNSEAEAKELYRVLLREALGNGEKMRLVISADGALSFVAFEGLVRADGRYTLSDHIVSYVPSGTFLWLVRTAPRAQAPRRFLGIGGVAYTQVASRSAGRTLYRGLYDLAEVLRLEDLPSTGDEVLAAAHTLGDESHLLLGDRATETTFKSEPLKDFEVIHLAVVRFRWACVNRDACPGYRPAQALAVLAGVGQGGTDSFSQNLPFELRDDRQQAGHGSPRWRG